MAVIYLVPNWFFGLGIALELLFALAAAVVAFYAFKFYKISGQREGKLFSFSFVLISISYLIKAGVNLFVLSDISSGFRALDYDSLNDIGVLGLYAHVILFIAGLALLSYMTLKTKNRRAFLLLLVLAIIPLLPVVSGANQALVFNLVSSIFLLYLCTHYFVEYKNNKNHKTLLILCAFLLLFFSGIGFMFANDFYVDFVLGHLLEFISYILIVTGLVLTIRKH